MRDRYHWLKLQTSFFDSDEMRVILSQENGAEYGVFWIKLLLKSIKDSEPGLLRFREDIPYDDKTIATVTQTDIDTVRVAIKLFQQLGMLRIMENGDMWIDAVQSMVGTETKWAEYKRVERAKRKELDNVKGESKKSPEELELDKELDIDKEKEKSKTSATKAIAKKAHPLYKQVQDAFLSVQPDKRFVSFPKEGKAINRLIAEAEARCPEGPWEWIKQVMGAFADLHQGKDKFWKGQPILPSVLMSNGILPRVLQHMTEDDFSFDEAW